MIATFVVPHPPIIVPGVGKGEEVHAQATIDAYHSVAREIAEIQPDLIVLSTPHGELYRDAFQITTGMSTWGDFADFRDPRDRLEFDLDEEFIAQLLAEADAAGLPYVTSPAAKNKLDHGCMVPLYFIAQHLLQADLAPGKEPRDSGYSCKIVRIAVSLLDEEAHFQMGQCVARSARVLGRRCVYVASGDLSHKLKGSHYGFNPAGPVFDRTIVDIFASGQLDGLMHFDPDLREAAAECGLNSFIIMSGALDGSEFDSELLSYEAPWGIGYGVARFKPKFEGMDNSLNGDLEEVSGACEKPSDEPLATEAIASPSLPVRLAFAVLEDQLAGDYLSKNGYASPTVSALLNGLNPRDREFYIQLTEHQAGCFVSFHKGSDLRGCIGTITATCDNVFKEICQNTVSAATCDPRFPEIQIDEVKDLHCSVDILGKAEAVSSINELDAKRYGVIVSKGFHRGVLLPDLEGVDTPEEQIAIALRKASISPKQKYNLERFEVLRYE